MLPIILNEKAGTLVRRTADLSGNSLKDMLRAIRPDVDVRVVATPAFGAAVEKALAEKPDRIIVGGGDGSVNWAAQKLTGTDVALGVLPVGTFNFFARDLGMPVEIASAIRALATAEPRDVDVGEVNGQVFLCACVLGFLPRLFLTVDQKRGVPWWGKMTSLLHAAIVTFNRSHQMRMVLTSEERKEEYRTRFLAIANNAYEPLPGFIPKKGDLEQGVLRSYISSHRNAFSLASALTRYFVGTWDHDPDLHQASWDHVTVEVSRRRREVRAMLDGEYVKFQTPLRFSIHRAGLKALSPIHDFT